MRRGGHGIRALLLLATLGLLASCEPDAPPVYETWRTFGTADGLPDESIRAVRIHGEDLWVGTDGGLALRKGSVWKSWTTADGLPWPRVTAIDVDPGTEDVWLGTWGGGIVRFSGGRFDQFTQFNSGLAGDIVLDLCVAGGRIWVSTNGGVSAYDPVSDAWELYFERRPDARPIVVARFAHSGEALYGEAWFGPLLRYDASGDRWVEAGPGAARRGPPGDRPDAASASPATLAGLDAATDGTTFWRMTLSELIRSTEGRPAQGLAIPSGTAGPPIATCLAFRGSTEAWIGSDEGLSALVDWDSDAWLSYQQIPGGRGMRVSLRVGGRNLGARDLAGGLPDNRIRCVSFEGSDIWVGTARGLVHGTDRGSPGRFSDAGLRPPHSWPPPASSGMPGQEDSRGPQGQANATPPDAPGSGEIRIGLLVPINKPIPPPGGGSPWPRGLVGRAGIERAIAEENAREERAGRSPLVLSVATSTFSGYGWGRSEDSFGVLPVEFGVRALVGWIGRDDLVQTLLAARLGLPIVNSAPELPTPDESASAWIFRCGSNDPRRHRALLDHVFDTVGATRLAIVRTPGSRKHLDWWSEYALERGHPVVAQIDWDPGAPDPGTAVELIRRSRAQVVLTWAGASDSAKLLRAMRKAGLDQLFVGSEAIGSSEFLEGMDAAAGRVLCFERCPHHAASAVRGGSPPGQAAAEAPGIAGEDFEAGEHLVEAIRRGGPEPERIRDELRRMSSVTLLELKDGAWNRRPARSIFR